MKRIGITFIGILTALSVLLVSCSDDTETPGNPPELPPKASLSANLGSFPQNGNGRVDETYAKNNVAFAAINVGFWQTIVAAAIAVPAVAFDEAFDHSFEYVKDQGKWKSEYTVNVSSKSITAELFAENKGETVVWEMYLSSEGDYEDFLWFTGESRVDNTGGDWVLYGSPSEPREILMIEWDREGADFINSKYVLVDEQASREGSYIAYGVSAEAAFTHYYDVSIEDTDGENYDASILYHETSKEGRVKSSSHFGDSEWRCWDTDLEDADC